MTNAALDSIAGALEELEKARRMLSRARGAQVRNAEHREFLKAVALSWFNARRNSVYLVVGAAPLTDVDDAYRAILDATERAAAKTTYSDSLRMTKAVLINVRGGILGGSVSATSSDLPPDFIALAADPLMRGILQRRWEECTRCVGASAYLSATVMMGGLLEALLVARANRLANKGSLFRAKGAPVDPKTKKPLELRQWTLGSYIDVAHELGWITKSAKDVAVVLRDYRNYVHPEKERSHGVTLNSEDAKMFWELTKTLSRQLLQSATSAAPGA